MGWLQRPLSPTAHPPGTPWICHHDTKPGWRRDASRLRARDDTTPAYRDGGTAMSRAFLNTSSAAARSGTPGARKNNENDSMTSRSPASAWVTWRKSHGPEPGFLSVIVNI